MGTEAAWGSLEGDLVFKGNRGFSVSKGRGGSRPSGEGCVEAGEVKEKNRDRAGV